MRNFRHIPTRDIEHTCWELLRWFESPPYVQQRLKQRHGSAISDKDASDKADEIAPYVTQAREYFEAARSVTLATQPTLLFYGMENFAAAIALCADAQKRQAQIVGRGHGLTLSSAASARQMDLRELDVKIQRDGAIHDLLHAVSGDHYPLHASGGLAVRLIFVRRTGIFRTGGRVKVADLFNALPDVAAVAYEHYARWPQSLIRLHNVTYMPQPPDLEIEIRLLSPAMSRAKALLRSQGYHQSGDVYQYTSARFRPEVAPAGCLVRGQSGAWFLCRQHIALLPEIATYFAITFALGSLARYRPPQWAELISGQRSPAVHVIRTFLHLALTEFPILALRELLDEHIHLAATTHML